MVCAYPHCPQYYGGCGCDRSRKAKRNEMEDLKKRIEKIERQLESAPVSRC